MYSKTKLQVKVDDGLTDEFVSNIGVRQGDNLSPTLYINDIPTIFNDKCSPVTLGKLHLNCLMYADDLVIVSESSNGMKQALSELQVYCNTWGLTINPSKTKLLNVNTKENIDVQIDGEHIDTVKEVAYLGIILENTGHFKKCIDTLYKKGTKAIFKLKKTISPYPSVGTCLHLFNHVIKPILLYGCEIWTYSLFGVRNYQNVNIENIETFYDNQRNGIEVAQVKYGKSILGLGRSTDNLGVYVW